MTAHPEYFDFFSKAELVREFPVGDEFSARMRDWSADERRHWQEEHFLALVARAAHIPFYQRLWKRHGIQAEDITSIDDLASLPVYDKTDVMESISKAPPWGDFHGIDDFADVTRPPVITHTTSGTTGTPQVLTFGPRTREVQNLLLARMYRLQGLRPDDVVHSVYGHGLVNGGHYIREAITHWTGARFLSAGTGTETPSRRQVSLMQEFGVTVLVGFADYLMRLAEVARDMGVDPTRDLGIRMISGHVGAQDAAKLSAAWGGAEVFDWYGVGDTGIIAGEGPDHDGLYVLEDAHIVELLDVDSGGDVATTGPGDMVVTSLFTDDVYPIIRFNTHDVSAFCRTDSTLGFQSRRIQGFLGRSDNMIKLRGINIFPHAISSFLAPFNELNGEYICRVNNTSDGAEEMTVAIESIRLDSELEETVATALREKLGVKVKVDLTQPDALAAETGIESRQKPIRLIDLRR